MTKKLTITIDDEVYEGLYRRVGRRKISRFLESLARPHVVDADLEAAYQEMASDEARETDAEEWSEALIGDVADEPR
jgi:predicted CopG family antitoxin